MDAFNDKRIRAVFVWLLLFALSASVFGCTKVQSYIQEGEQYQGEDRIEISAFVFRESAFECAQEAVSTKVLATLEGSIDTAGMRLIAVCSETGDEIEMNDDGIGADTVAHDCVFYGEASFQSTEEKTLHYSLKSKDGESFPETTATVTFYTVASYLQEQDRIKSISEKLDEIQSAYTYREDADDAQNEEAYSTAVERMKAYLNEQMREGAVLSYEWESPYFEIRLPIGRFVYCFALCEDNAKAGGETAGYEVIEIQGENQAVLMLPYDNSLDSGSFIKALTMLSNADLGYTAEIRKNEAVAPQLLSSLQDYRVIVISSHGGCSRTHGPYFGIGIANEDISMQDYANGYLLRGSRGQAFVTSAYFEHYYEDQSLNDCLVYLGCCHCADSDLLANTLLRKGASAVLAYTHTVYESYDSAMVLSLFGDLIKYDDDLAQTHTIGTALQAAKKENGEKDPTNTVAGNAQRSVREENRAEMFLFEAQGKDPFRLLKTVDERGWYNAYRAFVFNRAYLLDTDIYYGSDFDCNNFGLYDFDRDGTPELVIGNGVDAHMDAGCHVYTYRDDGIRYLGEIFSWAGSNGSGEGLFFYDDATYTGLFFEEQFQNTLYRCYYRLTADGSLETISVEEGTYDEDWSEGSYQVEQRTSDDALFALGRDPSRIEFVMFSYSDIFDNGWDQFVRFYESLEAGLTQSQDDQEPEDQEPEEQEPEDQEPEEQEPEDQEPEDREPEDQEPEDQEPEQQEQEETLSGWKKIYRDFIRNGTYEQFRQYGEELWLALHDLDDDGTPELIYTDGGEWYEYDYIVCTIRNGSVAYIGKMRAPLGAWLDEGFHFLCSDDYRYPGLFMKTSIFGYYQNESQNYCGYFEVGSNGTVVEKVVEATAADGSILKETDEDLLYRVGMYGGLQPLRFCEASTLTGGGWDTLWSCWRQLEDHAGFDVWHAIEKSGVLNYISMTYDEVCALVGPLETVDVEMDSPRHYLFSFSGLSGMELSFDSDLSEAEEYMDEYGRIPANVVSRYINGTDRCDGMLVYSINAFGLSDINAADIDAEVREYMPDMGIWWAHAEHGGCDFYFFCDDSDGSISARCALWIVG